MKEMQIDWCFIDVKSGRHNLRDFLERKNGKVRLTLELDDIYFNGNDDGVSMEFCCHVVSGEFTTQEANP